MGEKYDIFISYRRQGGEYTAKMLHDRLEKLGYRVFFDVESLRSGDFNAALYSVIEECTDFLLVLSPGALDRCQNENDWVRQELVYAMEKGKNIVPIILRGFSFPDILPDAIAPVRKKNGIEANSEFFDAVVDKLCKRFLLSKPRLFIRFNLLPILITLLVAAFLGAGIYVGAKILDRIDSGSIKGQNYTEAEKNVVREVIGYAENHLQDLDILARDIDGALQAARKYVISQSYDDKAEMNKAFAVAYKMLKDTDPDDLAPTDGFVRRVGGLSGDPFDTADLIGMHDALADFREQWLVNLTFAQSAVQFYLLANTTQLNILNQYQTILEEGLKRSAYSFNELLVSINDQSLLDELFDDYFPGLTYIKFSVDSWGRDEAALKAAANGCAAREKETAEELDRVLDQMRADSLSQSRNEILWESLVNIYLDLGYSREEAEKKADELFQ